MYLNSILYNIHFFIRAETFEAARRARNAGATVFAIGVGVTSYFDLLELRGKYNLDTLMLLLQYMYMYMEILNTLLMLSLCDVIARNVLPHARSRYCQRSR